MIGFKLTLHIYLIIDVLVWSKLLWKSHGQFWHPSQWLRIVKIPSGQRLLQLASMWLILSGWNLYEHLDHICKKTGAEAYCSMKCHRIHHQYFFVCVEIVLYSDNNSDTELNFKDNEPISNNWQTFVGVDCWKSNILLTFVIKYNVEFIFWDDFFVKILIIC